MNDDVFLLSVLLMSAKAEFTPIELTQRTTSMIRELRTLFPRLGHLTHSRVVDTLKIEGDQVTLYLYLVPSNQVSLDLNSTAKLSESDAILLERDEILKSGEESQTQIYRLSISINSGEEHGLVTYRSGRGDSEDRGLRHLLRKHSGKRFLTHTAHGQKCFDFPEVKYLRMDSEISYVLGFVEAIRRDRLDIFVVQMSDHEGMKGFINRKAKSAFLPTGKKGHEIAAEALAYQFDDRKVLLVAYANRDCETGNIDSFYILECRSPPKKM